MTALTQILKRTRIELRKLKSEVSQKNKQLKELEKKAETFGEIKEAIEGLSNTRRELNRKPRKTWHGLDDPYDPGKYGPDYFYAESIEDDNIKYSKNFKPSLMSNCPDCGTQAPVLMSYTQTYDSPDGDEWTKDAFIICCNKIKVLKTISRKNRFLGV